MLRFDFLFTTVFGLAVHAGGTLRCAACSCSRDVFLRASLLSVSFLDYSSKPYWTLHTRRTSILHRWSVLPTDRRTFPKGKTSLPRGSHALVAAYRRKFVDANPSKPSSISGWTSSFPSGACSQYPRVKSQTQSTRKTLNHITFHISSFHHLSTDI